MQKGPSSDYLADCYRLLNVEPDASAAQIRQAYRDLVRVWHPDRFSNDARLAQLAESKLVELNAAYKAILKQGPVSPDASSRTDAANTKASDCAASGCDPHSAPFRQSAANDGVSRASSFRKPWRVFGSIGHLRAVIYAVVGVVAVSLIAQLFSAGFGAISSPYIHVAQILSRDGARSAIHPPHLPSLSDVADKVGKTVQMGLPLTATMPPAPGPSTGGLEFSRITAEGQKLHSVSPRKPRAQKGNSSLIPEPPITGMQLAGFRLHDGAGTLTVQNRTGSDATIHVARSPRRQTPISVIYVRANETLALTGFGTGAYAITAQFGAQWNRATKRFDHVLAAGVPLGVFEYVQVISADGMRADSYEIVLRPETNPSQ